MIKYRITCNKCKGHAEISLDDTDKTRPQVIYHQHMPIIACRLRPDFNWGFECGKCNNDSRLAPEEKNDINLLVSGASKETIKQMAKKLEMKPYSYFRMEPA